MFKQMCAIPGKMCALDAVAFNSGMSRSAVWEDFMVSPFGRRTVKGFRDLSLFKHGSVTKRKWSVQPESTISVACCSRRGGVQQALNIVLLVKVATLAHQSCWSDYLPCYQLEWLPLCGQGCECCKLGLCEPCPPCSHESITNWSQLQRELLGPVCRDGPGGTKPSVLSTPWKFPRVVSPDETWLG
jgi:hypothetical protein